MVLCHQSIPDSSYFQTDIIGQVKYGVWSLDLNVVVDP